MHSFAKCYARKLLAGLPMRAAIMSVVAVTSLLPVSAFAVNLSAYNADPNTVTISGISSGGYMAQQMGTAYSATFKGVGIFAGGPYMCAGHSNYTSCMYNMTISSSMLSTMQTDINNWSSGGQIDNKANIANQKIFMFVGNSDTTVGPNVMNGLQTQYTNNGVPAGNLQYVIQSTPTTAHTFPTDFDSTGNNSCGTAASPYISNCSYDGAGRALQKFYGTLNARNNGTLGGTFIEFNQAEFRSSPRSYSMDDTGWVYVPANCAAGQVCKLHVALHGCQQYYETIGDKFVKNTGYTRWADTNNIIVLFPQTVPDSTSHQTSASGSLPNPNGCWDWVGWYGTNFAQKAGPQMAAIKAMVDRIVSGYSGGGSSSSSSSTSSSGGGGTTVNFSSVSGDDGYVKCTSAGGSCAVGTLTPAYAGRGADGLYNRSVFSFDTSSIPDGATITRAYLTVTYNTISGDPWASPAGNTLVIDVKNGTFGAATMETGDWASAPTASAVATIAKFTTGTKASSDFGAGGLSAINKTGKTQLKLRFSSDQSATAYIGMTQGSGATLTVVYQ